MFPDSSRSFSPLSDCLPLADECVPLHVVSDSDSDGDVSPGWVYNPVYGNSVYDASSDYRVRQWMHTHAPRYSLCRVCNRLTRGDLLEKNPDLLDVFDPETLIAVTPDGKAVDTDKFPDMRLCTCVCQEVDPLTGSVCGQKIEPTSTYCKAHTAARHAAQVAAKVDEIGDPDFTACEAYTSKKSRLRLRRRNEVCGAPISHSYVENVNGGNPYCPECVDEFSARRCNYRRLMEIGDTFERAIRLETIATGRCRSIRCMSEDGCTPIWCNQPIDEWEEYASQKRAIFCGECEATLFIIADARRANEHERERARKIRREIARERAQRAHELHARLMLEQTLKIRREELERRRLEQAAMWTAYWKFQHELRNRDIQTHKDAIRRAMRYDIEEQKIFGAAADGPIDGCPPRRRAVPKRLRKSLMTVDEKKEHPARYPPTKVNGAHIPSRDELRKRSIRRRDRRTAAFTKH